MAVFNDSSSSSSAFSRSLSNCENSTQSSLDQDRSFSESFIYRNVFDTNKNTMCPSTSNFKFVFNSDYPMGDDVEIDANKCLMLIPPSELASGDSLTCAVVNILVS